MSRPRFRVGRRRPTNIYVQLGDEPSDVDPQIGYANEGWAKTLVEQANWSGFHSCPPPVTPLSGTEVQYREIYEAAGRLLRWFDGVEHLHPGSAVILGNLRAVLERHDTVPGQWRA